MIQSVFWIEDSRLASQTTRRRTTNCLYSSNRDRTTRITRPVGRADGHPSRARTSTVVVHRHDGQLIHVVARHAVRSSHVTLSTLCCRLQTIGLQSHRCRHTPADIITISVQRHQTTPISLSHESHVLQTSIPRPILSTRSVAAGYTKPCNQCCQRYRCDIIL